MIRRSSFRTIAFGLTAAALVGASAMLGTFSAAAQSAGTTGAGTSMPIPCANLRATNAGVHCALQQMDRRIQSTLDEGSCTDSIIAIVKSGDEGKARVRAALNGRMMRDVNACNLLSTLTKS